MAYTFTSWTDCTDPASNSRTLDWSESGMRGQPPGIYLEALRQAAILRNAVYYAGVDAPGVVSPQPCLVELGTLIEYLDAVAWHTVYAGGANGYWADPASITDYSGTADEPTSIDSEAALLTAIGAGSRIAAPTSIVGATLDGAWMRQVKACLQAKVYSWHSGVCSSATWKHRTGTGADVASAITAWDAASWVTGTVSGNPQHYIQTVSGTVTVLRKAARVTWPQAGLVYPVHAAVYAMPTIVSGGISYVNPDYAEHGQDEWWCYDADADLTGGDLLAWLGDIGTVTLTTDATGYQIVDSMTVADWGAEWDLGA